MLKSQWMVGLAMVTLASLGGLLGGTLLYWSRQPEFPVYGYIFDACLLAVLVFAILRFRRWKAEMSDEFAVAKKRMATQVGFIAGFVLYTAVNVLPFLLPHHYNAIFGHLDGPREGFILGQVAGMAPFVLGLLFGQVYTWVKYR